MALKINFSKFSNLPCLLAEVMVKIFFSLFIAVICRTVLIPYMEAGQQAIFWICFFLQTVSHRKLLK